MARDETNLEETFAAAMKLHTETNAAGFTGAGELTEERGEDRAGQCLLQQTESCVKNISQDLRKDPECFMWNSKQASLSMCASHCKSNKSSEKGESIA